MLVRNISDQPLQLRVGDAFTPTVLAAAQTPIPPGMAGSVLCQPWFWEAADDDAWQAVAEHIDAVEHANRKAATDADEAGEPLPPPVLTWFEHPHVAEVEAAGRATASQKPPTKAEAKKAAAAVVIDSSKAV